MLMMVTMIKTIIVNCIDNHRLYGGAQGSGMLPNNMQKLVRPTLRNPLRHASSWEWSQSRQV